MNNRETAYDIGYEGWPSVFTHHTSPDDIQDQEVKALTLAAFEECKEHIASVGADLYQPGQELKAKCRRLPLFQQLVTLLKQRTGVDYDDWGDARFGDEESWEQDDSLPQLPDVSSLGPRTRTSGLAERALDL